MWGQKEQQEHSQHGLYLLTHIHQTLQELIKQSKGDDREAQREIITLADAAYPYAANGYRYNGLYVSGGETVTVEYRGFSYSQVLQAGWNQLNLPDGCTVSTAGNAFMAEIVRDNEQYEQAVDAISGNVSLTGSNVLQPYDAVWTQLASNVVIAASAQGGFNIPPTLLGWENVGIQMNLSGTSVSWEWVFYAYGKNNDSVLAQNVLQSSSTSTVLNALITNRIGATSAQYVSQFGDTNKITVVNTNTTNTLTVNLWVRRWN